MVTTRVCSQCGKPKSVNGVWYLISRDAPSAFVCGSCFTRDVDVTVPLPV